MDRRSKMKLWNRLLVASAIVELISLGIMVTVSLEIGLIMFFIGGLFALVGGNKLNNEPDEPMTEEQIADLERMIEEKRRELGLDKE